MLVRPGMRVEFESAVEADPTFGFGHAALAGLDILFGRDPSSHLVGALAHVDRASEAERATIAFIQRCATVEPAARFKAARAHLTRYPLDLLAAIVGVASGGRGPHGSPAT